MLQYYHSNGRFTKGALKRARSVMAPILFGREKYMFSTKSLLEDENINKFVREKSRLPCACSANTAGPQ